MTDPVFDIKQATAIVQPYDSNAENLDSFVDAVKLLKDVLLTQVATAIRLLKPDRLAKPGLVCKMIIIPLMNLSMIFSKDAKVHLTGKYYFSNESNKNEI